jgi:hypothetical protein
VTANEHPADRLVRALPDTLTVAQRQLVERAYTVAAYWHRGQKRKSGDPYITHPVAVAVILTELGMDHEIVCAGLLHDVLLDTACSEAELTREFGQRITDLLVGLRTLEDPPDDWESITDERVLTLKLVDRLHNLRTMRFLSPDRQRQKSVQTLEEFVPVARRLGMDEVRRELEELATTRLSSFDETGIRASFLTIAAGSTILPYEQRARWLEEWLSDLHALPDGSRRRRFTAQLLAGMPKLAVTLRWPLLDLRDLMARRLRRFAGWIVETDARAWAVLAPLLIWLVVEAAATSLSEAATIAITVPPVLGVAVRTLRARLRK